MSLFDGPRGLSYPTALLREERWYALLTRARMEKRSAAHLNSAGVETEAVVAEAPRQWSDRIRRVGKPLFPGYIFARFTLAGIALPLSYPGIVGVVRNEGIPVPIRDSEIDSVRRLVAGASTAGVLPSEVSYDEIASGTRVLVTTGPFEGLRGTLIESRGRGIVAVHIEAIRQVRSVQLDLSALTPLPEEDDDVDGIAPEPSLL